MKSLLAMFGLLLLSGCQSVTQLNAEAVITSQKEVAISAEPLVQGQQTQNEAGVIANIPLKQAVDVEQIDSLMLVSESQASASQSQKKVIKKAVVIEESLHLSSDPITLMLLERGDAALANQKLLTPEDDNANLYFQAALGREPQNEAARKGIEEIVRFYTGWALDKAKQGQNTSSRTYLAAASFVDVNNRLIKQTKRDIKNWQAGIRGKTSAQQIVKSKSKALQNKFYLPKDLFSLSEALVIQKLQPIIDRIEKDQLNIEIFWPNDKEARLLYRIINSRTEDFRVRGMIYRRAQHMIEVKQG